MPSPVFRFLMLNSNGSIEGKKRDWVSQSRLKENISRL